MTSLTFFLLKGVVSQLKLCVCQQTCLTMTIVGSIGARTRDGYRGLINNRPYFFPLHSPFSGQLVLSVLNAYVEHYLGGTGYVEHHLSGTSYTSTSQLTGMFLYHLSNILRHHYIVYLLDIY